MSPERLEGKEADARGDIFSFGCVLLEMLTGRRAFTGDKPAQLISAIVTKDPLASAPLVSPPSSRAGERYPSLPGKTSRGPVSNRARPGVRPGGALRRFGNFSHGACADARWRSSVPGLGRCGVAGGGPSRRIRAATLESLGRATKDDTRPPPPDKTSFNTVAVSPDGRQLALTARDTSGTIQLWVRAMDSLSARPLAGTEGAVFPFWSPDSRFIAITAGSILKRIEPPASRGESPLQQGFALRNDQRETAYAGCVESLTLVPQQSLCVRRIQDEALAVIAAVVPGNLGGAIQDARSY